MSSEHPQQRETTAAAAPVYNEAGRQTADHFKALVDSYIDPSQTDLIKELKRIIDIHPDARTEEEERTFTYWMSNLSKQQ